MPTIYQDRSGISLYDAQHNGGVRVPVPSVVIDEVLRSLLRFKRTCQDFGVRDSNIKLVATEATRNAINRDDLLQRIDQKTGWKVQLLAKEDEGKLGAMGVASSFPHVDGLCMDMGGGSVQLTWVTTRPDGLVDMSPMGSVSFPYGAAALTLEMSKNKTQEQGKLSAEIASKLNAAMVDLQIPQRMEEAAKQDHGYHVYLSGGGLRGWGYMLMSHAEQIRPYPIQSINGYSTDGRSFLFGLDGLQVTSETFRVSSRRASQAPAVRVLIEAIRLSSIPIFEVHFARGGVREGLLYTGLDPSVRAQHPLVAATLPYAPKSADCLVGLLRDSIPDCSSFIEPDILISVINLLYVHDPLPKDIRAAAALRSTTTGILAGAHGLSHREMGLLALVLCERWGADHSDLDIGLYHDLQRQYGELSWWMKYVGRAANGLANLFPAGVVWDNEQTISVESGLYSNEKGVKVAEAQRIKGIARQKCPQSERCWIKITVLRNDADHVVREWAKDLRKVGKKKNRVGEGEGYRLKVDVNVEPETARPGRGSSSGSGEDNDEGILSDSGLK